MLERATRARAVVVIALVPTLGGALLGVRLGSESSPILDVAVGMFAGFASALVFALALLATTITQWPPVAALVLRPPVIGWATATVLSVFFSFLDSVYHRRVYAVTALATTAGAVAIGTLALLSILSAVGGAERRRLNGRLLAVAIRRTSRRTGGSLKRAWQVRDDFIPAAAADSASDTRNLIAAFEALLNAADAFVEDDSAGAREREGMVRLLLEFQMLLPATLRRGEALDELSALIGQASGRVAVISGRIEQTDEPTADAPVHWLAAQTRTHNWTALSIAAIADDNPRLDAQCARLIASVQEAQTTILRCVDPDPPLEYIPARHPWHRGVRDDPLGLMVWYACAFDYHGILENNSALYVIHESLLRTKNPADFNFGTVLAAVERGVAADPLMDDVFAPFGGFTALLFDVLANSLATCVQASWASARPVQAGDGWVLEAARVRSGRLAWIVPGGAEPALDADRVADLVVACIGRAENSGFECHRRRELEDLGSSQQPPWWSGTRPAMLQPPWSRILSTPIFHLAAGALMLASWAPDPRAELIRYGDRLGPGGRRAAKAALDTVFGAGLGSEALRAAALDLGNVVDAGALADAVLAQLEHVR